MSIHSKFAAAAAIVMTILIGWPCVLQAELVCARNGQPAAEIVIPENADTTIELASRELQFWIEKISGASLPVVKSVDPAKAQIVLDPVSSRYPADLEKFKGNDGFSIREQGRQVFVNAGCPKGVLNGVFQLLYKNSDIIWARPDKTFGTVFSENPNLTLTQTDFIDIPAFTMRGWLITPKGAENIWQVRNRANWVSMVPTDPLKRAYGCILEDGGGHNLVHRYITEAKYLKTHPEFYPLKNGKRLIPHECRGGSQLCFTNQEMVRAFIKEVDAFVKSKPQYSTYKIIIEDESRKNYCECPECMKPIPLPGGRTIGPDDPAFHSTRFFLFLNQVARAFKREYPGKRILTLAYDFTVIPPVCPLESNIDVSYAPIMKNSRYPITHPANRKSLDEFTGWLRITRNLLWREYYGLYGEFPRPIDTVAFADWQYVHKNGVVRTYSEMRTDRKSRKGGLTSSWDANSMYFWMLAEGCWNPHRDVKALRREFLERVYGKAADDVAEYYRLIEEQWDKSTDRSLFTDVANTRWRNLVIKTGIAPQCRAALDRAEKKVDKPNGKKMLASLRANFDAYINFTENRRLTAVRTAAPPPFDPEFKSGDWAKTSPATQFFWNTTLRPHPDRTELRLLYDNDNLYIGFRCEVPDVKKMKYRAATAGEKVFPKGEGVEVFLTDDVRGKRFLQVTTDPAGNRFARSRTQWSSQVKITEKGWSALITLPWKNLKARPQNPNGLKGLFVRHHTRSSYYAILFSGTRHRLEYFYPIELK